MLISFDILDSSQRGYVASRQRLPWYLDNHDTDFGSVVACQKRLEEKEFWGGGQPGRLHAGQISHRKSHRISLYPSSPPWPMGNDKHPVSRSSCATSHGESLFPNASLSRNGHPYLSSAARCCAENEQAAVGRPLCNPMGIFSKPTTEVIGCVQNIEI